MNWLRFLALIVLAASCDPPPGMEVHIPHMPDKQSLSNEVRNHTILELRAKKDLRACGVGSGMMNQIKMLAISFYYYNEVNIDQARDLLMTASTIFLRNINTKEKIRPFLQNYPFEAKNIEIRIFLMKPDGSRPDAGNLTIVTMIEDELTYSVARPGTKMLDIVYEETFDEALTKWKSPATAVQ